MQHTQHKYKKIMKEIRIFNFSLSRSPNHYFSPPSSRPSLTFPSLLSFLSFSPCRGVSRASDLARSEVTGREKVRGNTCRREREWEGKEKGDDWGKEGGWREGEQGKIKGEKREKLRIWKRWKREMKKKNYEFKIIYFFFFYMWFTFFFHSFNFFFCIIIIGFPGKVKGDIGLKMEMF